MLVTKNFVLLPENKPYWNLLADCAPLGSIHGTFCGKQSWSKNLKEKCCSEIQDGESTSYLWLVSFWFEKGPDSRRAETKERSPS